MKNHVLALLTGFIGLAIILAGCNRGQVSVDETYAAMRPLKQLELPDQVTDNLVIIVSNVADQSSSYKNYIELEINDRKVRPNWDVSNIENTYTYRLRLRPGYYKVKAHYYAYIGWGEDRYPIETEDLVQVTSLQRTVLTCNIVKRPNGEPVDKKMYFKTQNEPFDTSLIGPSVAQPVAAEPAAKPADAPTVVQAPPAVVPSVQTVAETIALQINTVPEHCQVIVDDQVVGQSPLKIAVQRNSDHVLQAAAAGYRTGFKVIDRAAFTGKDQLIVILELEREKE